VASEPVVAVSVFAGSSVFTALLFETLALFCDALAVLLFPAFWHPAIAIAASKNSVNFMVLFTITFLRTDLGRPPRPNHLTLSLAYSNVQDAGPDKVCVSAGQNSTTLSI
jgi:hypothetical protein